jgi:hypothetical protein
MISCMHLDHIRRVTPRTPEGCEECLKMGDVWVHLRLCLECGHVGCCDSSKNKHARKHFHRTDHPIVRSFESAKTGAGAMSMRLNWTLRNIRVMRGLSFPSSGYRWPAFSSLRSLPSVAVWVQFNQADERDRR